MRMKVPVFRLEVHRQRFRISSLSVLGGSWLGISRVISRITFVITYIKGLITPFITSHEPPSRFSGPGCILRLCKYSILYSPLLLRQLSFWA